MRETPVTFVADGLRLEGRLALPPGAARAAAVCHPHPEYGGDMDDPVVAAVAGRLAEAGVATLRFNFRGTGASEGRHDGSLAETADAAAAVAFLAERSGVGRLVLAGYSFGALVAALAGGTDPRVERLALIALPVGMLPADAARRLASDKPKLFVQGDHDAFCPGVALERLVAALPGENEVRWLVGADHFLFGHGEALADVVAAFVLRGA